MSILHCLVYPSQKTFSSPGVLPLPPTSGTSWKNVFPPRRTMSNWANFPLSGEIESAWTPHTLKEA